MFDLIGLEVIFVSAIFASLVLLVVSLVPFWLGWVKNDFLIKTIFLIVPMSLWTGIIAFVLAVVFGLIILL